VPVTEENKVVLENQQKYRLSEVGLPSPSDTPPPDVFLKPGTLSLICVSIYYKRIKPQGAEYDEGFLFRLYVNLYVASIGSKTHLVEYWHSVIPFFCAHDQAWVVYFLAEKSQTMSIRPLNLIDQLSIHDYEIYAVRTGTQALFLSQWRDLSEINAFYRRPNFTPLISAENALLITAPSLQFQLLQFVTFVAENIPFNEKYFQAMLISKGINPNQKKINNFDSIQAFNAIFNIRENLNNPEAITAIEPSQMAESSESEQENEKLVYNDTFITNLNQNPVVLLKLLAQYDTNSTENESLKTGNITFNSKDDLIRIALAIKLAAIHKRYDKEWLHEFKIKFKNALKKYNSEIESELTPTDQKFLKEVLAIISNYKYKDATQGGNQE
jgi:hypothetical protein